MMISNPTDEDGCIFQPFSITTNTIENVQDTKLTEINNEKVREEEILKSTQPNIAFEEHAILPVGLQNELPIHLISAPLSDIDHFYEDQKTFIAINGIRQIFRFSATDSLWLFSPFSSLRRASISVMINRYFAWFIIGTVLLNCLLIFQNAHNFCTLPFEPIFLTIYVLEFLIKVIARGFVVSPFSYLRDPWNWVDLILILIALITGPSNSNFWYSPILSELRILKIIPNSITLRKTSKLIAESVKKLVPILVYIVIILFVTSVTCLMLYMGVLTQTCVSDPTNLDWHRASRDSSRFLQTNGNAVFCGNTTGSYLCPPTYVCLQGIRPNPDYGFTNFDTFGFSSLTVYRLFLRDYWEDVMYNLLSAVGTSHIFIFIWITFLCSYYLSSLIWGQIAHTYNNVKQERWEESLVTDLRAKEALRINVQPIPQQETWGTKLQRKLFAVIYDPFAVLFIILCILLNTVALALDHHNMTYELARVLTSANYFFVAVFTVEAALKILALGPKRYFSDEWNLFDFIVTALGVIELGLEGVQGLSILRAFRLLRPLRLGKVLPSFDLILHRFRLLFTRASSQTIFVCIIIFIFTVYGTRHYGLGYIAKFPTNLPRWNFTDQFHSFMVVFRALCGEAVETMFVCLYANGPGCIAYYLALILIGNFAVSHLFIALLFESDDSKALPALDRRAITEKIHKKFQLRPFLKDKLVEPSYQDFQGNVKVEDEEAGGNSRAATLVIQTDAEDIHDHEENVTEQTKCCPQFCYDKLPIFSSCDESDRCKNIRSTLRRIGQNFYYDAFVFIILIVGCISLAQLWSISIPNRRAIVNAAAVVEMVFVIVFLFEFVVKLLSGGLKSYFTNVWSVIDLINTIIPLWNIIQYDPVVAVLLALRPLSIISRCSALKIVTIALLKQLSAIANVILICSAFWFIFAIMGVQMFAGKFIKCVDSNGIPISPEIVPNMTVCQNMSRSAVNSHMNFDNVVHAYFSLLQVASFKGWIQIIQDATDSREIDKQPIRETSIYTFNYFVFFIILCVFCCLNVIIGVLIAYLRRVGNPSDVFMTPDQSRAVREAEAKANTVRLQDVPNNMNALRAHIYNLVTSKKFDLLALICHLGFILALSLDAYQIAPEWIQPLSYTHLILIALYLIETLLRLFGLRGQFFQNGWNNYDLFVCIFLVLDLVAVDISSKYFISPIILRIIRILRFRSLLLGASSSFVILSKCYTRAWRSLLNLIYFLLLVMFVYALLGMILFNDAVLVSPSASYIINFQTLRGSLLVLLEIITGAGWDGVLPGLENLDKCKGNPDKCRTATSVIYILSYLFITFTILLNWILVVVLEYYNQATIAEKHVRELHPDVLDEYNRVWNTFDTESSKYIPRERLTDLLDSLPPALRRAKPNLRIIRRMGIAVYKDNLVHHGEVLIALTRNTNVYADRIVPETLAEVTNGK